MWLTRSGNQSTVSQKCLCWYEEGDRGSVKVLTSAAFGSAR